MRIGEKEGDRGREGEKMRKGMRESEERGRRREREGGEQER